MSARDTTDQNCAAADPVLERIEPESHPGAMMAAEHIARYRWAAQFVAGKRVLDAGCGPGYGSAMLARAGAMLVTGIDLDEATIEAARPNMPAGVELTVGDLASLPLDDGSFDVVVCLEAIEHVRDPQVVLDELRRILAPAGVLVLSTPNRDVVLPGNPYHVHEYAPDELEATISRQFAVVKVRRQHTWIATAVLDDESFAIDGGDTVLDIDVRKFTGATGGEELTTLVVAGSAELELEADRAVLEICTPVELRELDLTFRQQVQTIRDQARHIDAQTRRINDQAEHIGTQARHSEDLRAERDQLRAALVAAERDMAHVHQLEVELAEVSRLAEELRDVEVDRDRWLNRYEIVVNSTTWKLTGPLRKVMDSLRNSRPDR
jgi:SAM-dependent methyltransferase